MKLVIAEKPSVAMSLAAVLGANEKKDGYLEGGGYLVSWCVGHLLELAQPEAYGEQYARWRYGDRPILPEEWKYEVPKDKKKQLGLLCRLMKDKRVESVVCATDAGREGELIFRLVYEHAGCKKPMERLWISSMEDAAIRDGFEHLRPGSDYDKLYNAAVCRAGADWLVGINATRLFSVLYGVTLNVGRVMSPTLTLLVQREADIQAFTSRPFYVPEITCGGFTASGEKLSGRNEAEKIRMDCDGQGALVLSVEKQVKMVQPPRLYDLTTLQRECNRIYGYTAQQTLDYVQSLYEKKLATYPRTDSQYLTEDMQATAASLIFWMRDNMPFGKCCVGEPDIDRITDGSKVTDHHAIIPTVEIARTDLAELPSGERDVLTLIAARLLSATAQAHRFEAVTAVLDCQGNSFTAKGKTVYTVLLADPQNPYSIMNDNYCGDGGIPGYIFTWLVPSEHTKSRLPVALAHETNHNVRFQFIKWHNDITLAEMMISEGLAENFATYLYGEENVGPWVSKTDMETLNGYIKPIIREGLDVQGLDNLTAYLYGDEMAQMQNYFPVGLPYCAGYACGYHMIKYYLKKTGKMSIIQRIL